MADRGQSCIPRLEWAAAALGLALVGTSVGFLAYRALTSDAAPPSIALRVEAIEPVTGGHVAIISALNTGASTAADVKVEGMLKRGSATLETSETTFRYLPPGSARRGGLFFRHPPAQFTLELQPKGYEAP